MQQAGTKVDPAAVPAWEVRNARRVVEIVRASAEVGMERAKNFTTGAGLKPCVGPRSGAVVLIGGVAYA